MTVKSDDNQTLRGIPWRKRPFARYIKVSDAPEKQKTPYGKQRDCVGRCLGRGGIADDNQERHNSGDQTR